MASSRFRKIRDRLPSLYRPEAGDTSLLTRYLLAAADVLEELNGEAAGVMQAHWFPYADQALHSPFFRRGLELEKKPVPKPDDPELERFPYVRDLARLGSLLSILPWGGPPAQRETVEQYRRRIADTVTLYRDGLGTRAALARMVRAQLPDTLGQPSGLRDQPFTVEEFPPVPVSPLQASTRGAPGGVLGPLMRWALDNAGFEGAALAVYIQGMEPLADEVAATERPLIELYAVGSERVRLGIAYEGTLANGETLRLRTAYASWIGGEDGLRRALFSPGEDAPANPVAPGPWETVPDAPAVPVSAFLQSRDRTVWAAVEPGDSGSIWRFDGKAWTEELQGLPPVRCLALDGDDLLAGTDKGLLRIPLHPEDGGPLTPEPKPEDLSGPAVHAILRTSDGRWWLGTEEGAARLGANDALESLGLSTPVYALHQDITGTMYLGTELGLFQLQPGPEHWYWYSGESHSDEDPDWQRFVPGESDPAADRVFLPPVRSIRRGPDSSLWIGTDQGIARYFARSVGGLTYTTALEAFPDLAAGRVFVIAEDARGALWLGTEQGLFRYDGRDWWQGQERLGAAEEPSKPVLWRFHRGSGRWQRFDTGSPSAGWVDHAASPVPGQPVVRALLWTDQAVADLGTWDEGTRTFTRTGDAPGALRMRYKPDELRIVDGGLPAVPRLPAGRSVWRYLSLEPEGEPPAGSRPAWTVEGRLLPPPGVDRVAPLEGRYAAGARHLQGMDLSAFDDAVFAYLPAARVWFAWEERRAPAVLVRLQTTAPGDAVDPVVLDRVWQGIQQVRPAGVPALLAVDEKIVRGV